MSAVGVVLFAVVACSRSAEQKNFLGEPCTVQGDCPAELLCVAGACWEPCQAGGLCADGFVCELGACVPGGTVTRDDSGSPDVGPLDSGGKVDSAGNPDTGVLADAVAPSPIGDGQLVPLALPADFSNNDLFQSGMDDTDFVYVKSVTDAFGQTTRTLRRIPLGGGAGSVAYTFGAADYPTGSGGGVVMNGSYYYTSNDSFMTKLDVSNGSLTQIAPSAGSAASPARRVGSKIFFEDYVAATFEYRTRFYDTATATLDPALYSRQGTISLLGSELTWANRDSDRSGPINNFYQATLGDAAAKMARTLPATTNILSMVASGADAVVLLGLGSTGGDSAFFKMKLTDMSAPVAVGSPARYYPIGTEDGKMYVYELTQGDAGATTSSRLVRVDVNGTQTTFGAMGTANYVRKTVTPTAVYGLTYPAPGDPAKLVKWMKPAP